MNLTLAMILGVTVSAPSQAHDYPTLDRVDRVLTCMAKHGGQTVDNLYACACEIDAIAAAIRFDDYVEAATFRGFRAMPGERGGLFRDSKRGQALVARLEEAERAAARTCFFRRARVSGKTATSR
ncbi:MAG: hypothetical protein ACREXS_06660 [Gammaproteobacteria bacterium]